MYICNTCAYQSPKWMGKCPECKSWNSFEPVVEKATSPSASISENRLLSSITRLGDYTADIHAAVLERIAVESTECARVFGGGIVPGSVVLLSGEPGIGKSTFALELTEWVARSGASSMYLSGEENVDQIASRAQRIGVGHPEIRLASMSILEDIIAMIRQEKPACVVIDSISVISSELFDAAPGSVTQIRYMTEQFVRLAKTLGVAIILIGHVTKDGAISGPKTLEHLVDTVLYLEGSRTDTYRILRAFKNRFGPTDEIGMFLMQENGLRDMESPGSEFIKEYDSTSIGSAIGMTLEGNRSILLEVEALTSYTKFGYPKRSAQGISQTKLDLLIAVLGKFGELSMDSYDCYINVSRGLSIKDPAIDLALLAAIVSSRRKKPIARTVFIGEVALTGKIRNVVGLKKRIEDARAFGFERIVVPYSDGLEKKKPDVVGVKNVAEFLQILE